MEAKKFLGIDIGGTKVSVSIGDSDGTMLGKIPFATAKTVEKVIDDCDRAIAELLATRHISQVSSHIEAIGISCGGPLDGIAGVIQSPPNLPGWDNVPIVDIFQEKYRIPVFLENDANACALAEWYWGNGRGCRSMIFLTFGTGLGAGLILDGAVYRGAAGLAGEVGHWKMAESGVECYHKAGSWESFCSGAGISARYEAAAGKKLSAKDICILARAGESAAVEVVRESAEMLGTGLALLVDLLNPQVVVIGSIYTRDQELFQPLMDRILRQETLAKTYASCKVLPSMLGDRLGDMAALGIARDRSMHDRPFHVQSARR